MTLTQDLFSTYKNRCLEIFSESIQECHRLGAQKWGATVASPSQFRLVMGNHIVASIEDGAIWLAVAADDTPAHKKLDSFFNWRWTDKKWAYKKPPSRSGYYWPMGNHDKVWPQIRRLHFQYLQRLAEVYDHLRISSQRTHSNAFLLDMEAALGISLPKPFYN